MCLVKVDTHVVEFHILTALRLYIAVKLKSSIKHIILSITTIGLIVIQKKFILMIITNQSIENTCCGVEIRTRLASFRLNIHTTDSTFVLLYLCCFQRIQNKELNHAPLDRIRTFFVEICYVHTFKFLHLTE